MAIRLTKTSWRTKLTNVGQVHVTLNTDESVKDAPIELTAGCSWTWLDVADAKDLIKALQDAIDEVRS